MQSGIECGIFGMSTTESPLRMAALKPHYLMHAQDSWKRVVPGESGPLVRWLVSRQSVRGPRSSLKVVFIFPGKERS